MKTLSELEKQHPEETLAARDEQIKELLDAAEAAPTNQAGLEGKAADAMWHCMGFCNGQIRVMAGRYGGGWLAAGCALIEWDFDDQWDDLVGGDLDYFDARDFFERHNELFLIEGAKSAMDAFSLCAIELIKQVAAHDQATNQQMLEHKPD